MELSMGKKAVDRRWIFHHVWPKNKECITCRLQSTKIQRQGGFFMFLLFHKIFVIVTWDLIPSSMENMEKEKHLKPTSDTPLEYVFPKSSGCSPIICCLAPHLSIFPLVGGWALPFWKICESQLGFIYSQYMESHEIPWFQTANQFYHFSHGRSVCVKHKTRIVASNMARKYGANGEPSNGLVYRWRSRYVFREMNVTIYAIYPRLSSITCWARLTNFDKQVLDGFSMIGSSKHV